MKTRSQFAPIDKRVCLAGTIAQYEVQLKDNSGKHVIWKLPVPTARMGHAVVRAIRQYADERNGELF